MPSFSLSPQNFMMNGKMVSNNHIKGLKYKISLILPSDIEYAEGFCNSLHQI